MKNVVIGTAGHIDHGKSTLVKALTHIETDTTHEEQKRGLTINLGFAYLDLPSGDRVGIVDVPGHEKFIKNMLAGASGIDLVLLVIDVNEGIMPQTKEHVAILTLLGIKNFIIVLTKVKDCDEDLKLLVYEDIAEQFANSPLADAPIIETDAIAGIGLEELVNTIDDKIKDMNVIDENLPARLNVDRAFSVKGFGTVITGTLLEGKITVGDDLYIYPSGQKTKVRSIQIHEIDQPEAHAGNRTALNLTKVGLDEIKRGDVLSAAPLDLTYMLDVKVQCLPESPQPLELWDRVHVHIGTSEILARIVPLGQDKIIQGETGYLQLRLEEPVAVKNGDHFILRSYSPVATIGGGTILEAFPEKHKRFNDAVLEGLQIKESGKLDDIIIDFLNKRSAGLTSARDIAKYLHEDLDNVNETVEAMVADNTLLAFGRMYMSPHTFATIKAAMETTLTKYHEENSLRKGMPLEEFRSQFNKLEAKEFDAITRKLKEDRVIAIDNDTVRLASFGVNFTPEQEKIKNELEKTFREAKLQPPYIDELTNKKPKVKQVVELMLGNELIKLDRYIYVHKDVYQEATDKVISYLEANGEITLANFRDMMDTTRKYGILFLEHLDEIGVTRREGDVRVLNKK